MNGRYAHVGVHDDKPKYKKVDGDAIIYYDRSVGHWFLNNADIISFGRYRSDERNPELLSVLGQWVWFHGARPAPNLSLGSLEDLQAGDEVTIVHGDRDVDWTGCPEESEGSRLSFSPPWSVTIQRIQGAWFYPTNFRSMTAPLNALGRVKLLGKEHRIFAAAAESSATASLAASSSAAPSASVSSPGASFGL